MGFESARNPALMPYSHSMPFLIFPVKALLPWLFVLQLNLGVGPFLAHTPPQNAKDHPSGPNGSGAHRV